MLLDGWVTTTDLLRLKLHKKYSLPSLGMEKVQQKSVAVTHPSSNIAKFT